jgi:hypothetical protein
MTVSPFVRSALDAVIPSTARWLLALMSRLEEHDLDAATRWEFLKRTLTNLRDRAPAQERDR